jgi:hypothetical protein
MEKTRQGEHITKRMFRHNPKSFKTFSDKFNNKCKLEMIKSLMEDVNLIECKLDFKTKKLTYKEY